ncbi:MAG: type II secretion system F family protein [Patescibacteria group bacterium]
MEKKDFATFGTETYKLGGKGHATGGQGSLNAKGAGSVIINIQESTGVILDHSGEKDFSMSGNIFKDWFHKINGFFIEHSAVKPKDKGNFYHLLSVMINAGIPMVKALKALQTQMPENSRLRMIIRQVASDIEAGDRLSEAMLPYKNVFAEAEIGMMESGEASGQLTRVLENLAKDAEKAYMIKAKVKSAMMYPMVIFSLLILVVIGLMMFVIPKLKELFTSFNGELPLVTRIVVGISDFMQAHGLLMLAGFLGVVLFLIIFKKTEVGRYAFDSFKLKIPVFGALFQKAYLSRFARSISNLLDSNVSIVKTLEITANSIGNEVYRKSLLLSSEDIKQGIPLAENLNNNPLFPPMLVSMIDVGEKTAQLDEITDKVAKFYEDEVDTSVSGISKIIEPIMLVIIGVTVGIVVAAIMLPIVKLSNIAGQV